MNFSTDPNPAPHQPPPWGILPTIAWALVSFLASVLVAAGFYSISQSGTVARSLSYDGVAIAIGTLASVPVQVAVLAFAAQLRHWAPAVYLGLNIPKRGEIVFAALCVVAINMAFDALLYVSGRDLVPPFQVEAYQSAKDAGWLVALTVAIVFVAPFGEEVLFRGFLYRGFVRPGREMIAIAVIALAWALLHIQYDWLGMAQIFSVGLLFGWFRWASGSTTLTFVMHILINIQAMLETAIKMEWLS